MKNSEYWQGRFEQIEAAANKTAEEYANAAYAETEKAQKEFESEISAWYARFAANNEISLFDAKRLLNAGELAEFKWDVAEYIKRGQENAVNQKWHKELENASARYHITRLEALKYEVREKFEKVFDNQTHIVEESLKKAYLGGYYHTAFEVQKGIGAGWDIAAIDEKALKRVISTPWATDGKNFSDRIWGNRAKLISEVQTQLSQNLLLGRSPDQAISRLSKTMGVTRMQAGRLIMTESAYMSSLSERDALIMLGVDRYEILATLDSSTSEICREMDGKIFSVKDMRPGETAPPFHPWCRSTTVPYYEDIEGAERMARDENGELTYVPADMSYSEWEEKFVKPENNAEKLLKSGGGSGIIEEKDRTAVGDVHYIGKLDVEKYSCVTRDIVTDEVIITERQVVHIKERHPNDYERFSAFFKDIVENPDYIIEANRPNTALVLKEIHINGEKFKTVVRLATSSDNSDYKNSIITFMKIDGKEWDRILNNKKVLYKSE